MPSPHEGESREDFLERCIPLVMEDGAAEDQDQAVSMCGSMYDEAKAANHELLKAIRQRHTRTCE